MIPRVLFSACLGFDRCRYNGEIIQDEFVNRLKLYVEPVTVCPERAIGLGVPREPIRIVYYGATPHLVQPATGKDLSQDMLNFADRFLTALGPVDGFILKSRSPTCGTRDVKSYNEEGNIRPAVARQGFFGGVVLKRYPDRPVEDEGRLKNFLIRESFLTRLFTLARFREVRNRPTMKHLVEFHTTHKLLILAYSQEALRRLGRIVANLNHSPLSRLIEEYEPILSRALSRPPKYTSAINVLHHTLGYFSRHLTTKEKNYFLETVDNYRAGRVPLSVPVSIVRAWVARFDQPYLAKQWFFQPYPLELQDISDSGKGRNR